MKKMICVLLFVFHSVAVSADLENCGDWKKDWAKCERNEDCVVVTNPCGWPTASANTTHAEEASACNIRAGAALSCVSWSDMKGGERAAVCENGLCVNHPVE